ncbi:expressed unknown protein [Seminavis robusta]|uniref:MYND-type domain-containing protein n=1 Tax=Seminavis robusta TaxID=568900 RepID=A0A9N8DW26_9STRA|nr:expressed unknown protein [Seminavis robusta]|eukprot:Sro324_g117510.1 n/a (594) ;mRNA; f:21864-23741
MGKASKTNRQKKKAFTAAPTKPVRVQFVDWRKAFLHIKSYRGRTTDPEAMELDFARGMFRRGLAMAQGDECDEESLFQAANLIAQAFLLDCRSINWLPSLPLDEADQAGKVVMDMALLQRLAQSHINNASDDVVLQALLTLFFRLQSCIDRKEEDKDQIATGIEFTTEWLQLFQEQPHLEIGWFARPKVLFLRAEFFVSLNKRVKAVQDLTKALAINPGFLKARVMRADLWSRRRDMDKAVVFAEYCKVTEQAHVDSYHLPKCYAMLACEALNNPKLGSVKEAEFFFSKCLRSAKRCLELYGNDMPRKQSNKLVEQAKREFLVFWNGPQKRRDVREGLDAAFVQANTETERAAYPKSLHLVCLSCGKTSKDVANKNLLCCSHCRKVSYCSKECQRGDWAEHKEFCKMIMTKPTSQDEPPVNQDSNNRSDKTAEHEDCKPSDKDRSEQIDTEEQSATEEITTERKGQKHPEERGNEGLSTTEETTAEPKDHKSDDKDHHSEQSDTEELSATEELDDSEQADIIQSSGGSKELVVRDLMAKVDGVADETVFSLTAREIRLLLDLPTNQKQEQRPIDQGDTPAVFSYCVSSIQDID